MIHLIRHKVINSLFTVQLQVQRNLSIYGKIRMTGKTAGILVIGNEILKGEVLDTNSNYATKILHNLGVRVDKISVIPDNVEDIINETRLFSEKFDYVITTGGIGPTHDDVTFEAIGKAFNQELKPHPILLELCSQFYKTTDINAPGMKLAKIPENAKLTFGDNPECKMNFPNISVNNVYIFPGIPQLFQKLFDVVSAKLFASDQKFYTKIIYFNVTEQYLCDILEIVVDKFPDVTIGSYPEICNNDYKVRITVESTTADLTEAAYKKLIELCPQHYVVSESNKFSKME